MVGDANGHFLTVAKGRKAKSRTKPQILVYSWLSLGAKYFQFRLKLLNFLLLLSSMLIFWKNVFILFFYNFFIGFNGKSSVTVVYIYSCEIAFLNSFVYAHKWVIPNSSWETEFCFLLMSQVVFSWKSTSKPE